MLLFCFSACSKSEGADKPAPEYKLSTPENNAVDVRLSTVVEVVFDEVVKLVSNHGITINDEPADVNASFTKIVFKVDLNYDTSYQINIPKGAVINTFDIPLSSDIYFSFSTEKEPVVNPSMGFVANMGVGWNLGNSLDTGLAPY